MTAHLHEDYARYQGVLLNQCGGNNIAPNSYNINLW